MPHQKNILFLVPYPLGRAPSQRFRVEAFFPVLEAAEIEFRTQCFFSDNDWNILYAKGHLIRKIYALIAGFMRRTLFVLIKTFSYEYVFIHREASPIGPPIFEWYIAKVLRKKIIYDFDDAIWMQNTVTPNPVVDWVRAFWKIKFICKWSFKISGGNEFLCRFARNYNQQVLLVPTSVNTETRYHFLKKHVEGVKVVIGWTGSHTTLKYLELIFPVLERLQKDYIFDFLVIGNQKPDFYLRSMKFIEWKEASEIEDLAQIDIGIMPMFQDKFSEGKCGFKIIQYLALGIPAIASPVGVNSQIIEEGVNGFLCHNDEEWYEKLKLLITDFKMRNYFGERGRKKIENEFSVEGNAQSFLNLFT